MGKRLFSRIEDGEKNQIRANLWPNTAFQKELNRHRGNVDKWGESTSESVRERRTRES